MESVSFSEGLLLTELYMPNTAGVHHASGRGTDLNCEPAAVLVTRARAHREADQCCPMVHRRRSAAGRDQPPNWMAACPFSTRKSISNSLLLAIVA